MAYAMDWLLATPTAIHQPKISHKNYAAYDIHYVFSHSYFMPMASIGAHFVECVLALMAAVSTLVLPIDDARCRLKWTR
ncbi:PAS sensor protein [Paenibacillus sp. NAIST15-1]|nr:PAS sensor protein [Paenibacillus sp. NAIST15-1]